MLLHWFLMLSSLPPTPSKSDFACDIAGNWVRNPFCRNLASEIDFAFALVWLNHKSYATIKIEQKVFNESKDHFTGNYSFCLGILFFYDFFFIPVDYLVQNESFKLFFLCLKFAKSCRHVPHRVTQSCVYIL